MIEVLMMGNRWGWRFIGECGRTLWESPERFDREGAAADDAKAKRARFWGYASRVDHRMGACR